MEKKVKVSVFKGKRSFMLMLAIILALNTLVFSAGINVSALLFGDINGDGIINVIDLLAIKRHILKTELLSDEQLKCFDSEVTVMELLKVKRIILKIENAYEVGSDETDKSKIYIGKD